MGKKKDPGEVRDISYKSHGVWVRHKKWGRVGKIGYYDRAKKLVAVVWEPAADNNKKYSASLHPPWELAKVKGYDPEPWYNFEEIKRREKSLDGD